MKQIVIVGGVAAGLKTAARLRRNDATARITVVDKGELVSYGACGMPYYVGGDVPDVQELMKTPAGVVRNAAFFKNVKNIDILTQTLATRIDRQGKRLQVKDLVSGEERELAYDYLVLATGATPIRPSLPGMELDNIHPLWHPTDAVAIRTGLDKGAYRKAVIIGAGLIGIEMAEALVKRGAEVSIIEMKDQVFPGFLDEEAAAVVQKYLRSQGVSLLLGEKVERLAGEGAVREVITDKRTVAADLVVLAIGAKPNVQLAVEAGLEIGATGAIAVSQRLQTTDPYIFAGGDCVENVNMVSGRKVFAPMGSTANKHGRVIADNICGMETEFRGVLNTVMVKVLGWNVGKTGLTEKQAAELGYEYLAATVAGHDRPHYMPGAKPLTIKLIAEAKTGKLLGLQAFGEGDVAKRVDTAAMALTLGARVRDLFDADLGYAPPYSSPIDNLAVAALAVLNKAAGRLKGVGAAEAKAAALEDVAVILDVRSPDELKQLRMADCRITNIPLGQLRQRTGELDKEKAVVAVCKIGLRGYEAALILEGAGFEDVRVLEGGVLSWPYPCESGECEMKKDK